MWRWWSPSRRASPQQAQAERPAGTRPNSPGAGRNNKCPVSAHSENSTGEGAGGSGTGATVRLAEGNGGEGGTAVAEGAPPEEADTSTSANNSFLMGGGMGEAATPGEGGFGGRGGRGGRGWAALAAAPVVLAVVAAVPWRWWRSRRRRSRWRRLRWEAVGSVVGEEASAEVVAGEHADGRVVAPPLTAFAATSPNSTPTQRLTRTPTH